MKKTLSLFLAVLMIFTLSAATIAMAEDGIMPIEEAYTVKFVDYDGTELASSTLPAGSMVKAPENPTRDATSEYKYIFKGWSADGGETIYHQSTIPNATSDVTYTAIYSEQKIGDNQTFWSFISSIFERINMIFEYFAKIFSREPKA